MLVFLKKYKSYAACRLKRKGNQTLDRTVTDKMKSSANLGFYPSKQILRKALLADENEDFGDVLAELTRDFIDGLIEIEEPVGKRA